MGAVRCGAVPEPTAAMALRRRRSGGCGGSAVAVDPSVISATQRRRSGVGCTQCGAVGGKGGRRGALALRGPHTPLHAQNAVWMPSSPPPPLPHHPHPPTQQPSAHPICTPPPPSAATRARLTGWLGRTQRSECVHRVATHLPSPSPIPPFTHISHTDPAMDLDGIPPITRAWAAAAVAVAIAEHIHLIDRYQLFFSYRLVFEKLQLWRIFSCFCYFGPFGLDFLFHLFFFMRYSRMLEENSFAGRKADYLWLLVLSSAMLLLLSPFAALPFLGSPLAFVLVYVWSRRNRHVRLSLFGVLVITAPYLPWSLVGFSWLINGSPKAAAGDLLGVCVGHLYYFLVDLFPRELKSGGRNLLATPRFLVRLIDGR